MSAEVTLTEAERTRVLLAAALRAGYVDMPVLYAAVERIVAARVEQARVDERERIAQAVETAGFFIEVAARIAREGGPS